MESLIHPAILYGSLALGAVGVAVALPRKGGGPRALGGLIAAIAAGFLGLVLAVKAGEQRPSVFFYVFGLIALGASLRVITHPRPVYAALYFILTILSSAGLYLLLGAEFMTFALVIIYAGAILITYLFVIMLATEAPSAEAVDALKEYDASSREPIAATAVGFLLLAALTGMLATGVGRLAPRAGTGATASAEAILDRMPRKVDAEFARVGLLEEGEIIKYSARSRDAQLRLEDPERWKARLAAARLVKAGQPAPEGVRPLSPEAAELVQIDALPPLPPDGRVIAIVKFPPSLAAENIEMVGFALLNEHPLAIELAGVILLLALVGAVILARKQVEAGRVQHATAPRTLGRAA